MRNAVADIFLNETIACIRHFGGKKFLIDSIRKYKKWKI